MLRESLEQGRRFDAIAVSALDPSTFQALLDKLVGEISFDPMRFIRGYDAKQQRQILMKLVGLDFEDLDRQIEDELAKVKERLAELQNAKNAAQVQEDITRERDRHFLAEQRAAVAFGELARDDHGAHARRQLHGFASRATKPTSSAPSSTPRST